MNAESLKPSSFAIDCIDRYSSPFSRVTTRIECCPHPFENMSGSQLIGYSKKRKAPSHYTHRNAAQGLGAVGGATAQQACAFCGLGGKGFMRLAFGQPSNQQAGGQICEAMIDPRRESISSQVSTARSKTPRRWPFRWRGNATGGFVSSREPLGV